MGTPQTPDSIEKSKQQQAPRPEHDERPGTLSNPDEGDNAENECKGGHQDRPQTQSGCVRSRGNPDMELRGRRDCYCPGTIGFEWAHQDSNLEPEDYESFALTIEL